MKIKYGLPNNNIDVTDICKEKFLTNNIITIPGGNTNSLFTDPIKNVKKKIIIEKDDIITEYEENTEVKINIKEFQPSSITEEVQTNNIVTDNNIDKTLNLSKTLLDFKDIYKDNDIYILASGKSVDFIDNSFFDNKIIIGINQVYKKIPCQYLIRKEYELIDEVIDNPINKDTIIFISEGRGGGNNKTNFEKIQKLSDEKKKNIVIYQHNNNNYKIEKLPPNNKLVVSYSTITTGIHLAAHMGAKNIILIGHDCGTINGKSNFTGYHNKITYKIAHKNGEKDYIKWLSKIENQTITLKRLLKEKYNCNVYSLNPFINFRLEGNKYKAN